MAQRAVDLHAAGKAAHARAGGPGLAVLLTFLVAMGPVSTDLYLPSLPRIAGDLEASEGLAQLTIGLFVAGFGVMMLVCGPVADRFGRRPVLLGGMALYTLASIACALAPDIVSLLTARFVQALGACVGPVVGRAIVRDLYGPRDAGRILGYMSSAMALAPLVGPAAGSPLRSAGAQTFGLSRSTAGCSWRRSLCALARRCARRSPAHSCPASCWATPC